METDRNPMTTPNISPPPPPHHQYNIAQTYGDARNSFPHEDFGMSSNNSNSPVPISSSDANMNLVQSTQGYGSMSYHHQSHQRHHYDYSIQPQHWPGYGQFSAYPPPHLQQLQTAPSVSVPTPPPQTHMNQGVHLTDLNNHNPAAATNNEASQTQFNDRVLKSILESEAVKEAINNICKAAVEAAMNEMKGALPTPEKIPKVKFVTVKPRVGPQFDWEVSQDVYDDLRQIKMDQTMVKAVLVQLHPIKKLRHMLLSGVGQKNKNSTKLPDQSVQTVIASMIKCLWHKREEYLTNPDGLILDHRDYCQTVRTLISKSLQWFKENYDEDGNRLPVGKKHTRRSNLSGNGESSAHNGSGKGNKRSRRSNRTASKRNDHSATSLTSSDDDHIDPGEENHSSQEPPEEGTCNTNSSTGLCASYSGAAIPIAERPEPRTKPPLEKSVPITNIEVPDGFFTKGPRKSRQEPKKPELKSNPSTCNSRRRQPNSPKATSAHSKGHSAMSSKNSGRSSRENIMKSTSKGKENKASLRTTRLQSPIPKRPSSTSSRPEGRTPEATRTKAQPHTHAHDSQSQTQYSEYDISQDMDQY